MAMEGGGMIDFIMDIIRDTIEQAKADNARRTKREREQQQKSNKTSSTHKNQER